MHSERATQTQARDKDAELIRLSTLEKNGNSLAALAVLLASLPVLLLSVGASVLTRTGCYSISGINIPAPVNESLGLIPAFALGAILPASLFITIIRKKHAMKWRWGIVAATVLTNYASLANCWYAGKYFVERSIYETRITTAIHSTKEYALQLKLVKHALKSSPTLPELKAWRENGAQTDPSTIAGLAQAIESTPIPLTRLVGQDFLSESHSPETAKAAHDYLGE